MVINIYYCIYLYTIWMSFFVLDDFIASKHMSVGYKLTSLNPDIIEEDSWTRDYFL